MVTIRTRQGKKGFSIYLDIYTNNHRSREFLGLLVSQDYTENPKMKVKDCDREAWLAAQKMQVLRAQEVLAGTFDLDIQSRANACFVAFFKNKLDKKNNSLYRGAFCHLNIFSKGSIVFKNITTAWLSNFQDYLLRHVHKNTAAQYIGVLSIIWRMAQKENYTTKDPFKFLERIKMIDPKKEYLTKSELERLWATNPKKDWQLAFLFACNVGLRFSDISLLTRKEHIKTDKIVIRPKKRPHSVCEIPLNSTAKKILAMMPNDRDKIFKLSPHHHATNTNLKKWAASIGIDKNISFHVSRHTFATMALNAGAQLKTVSELLGHKSIAQTEVYAKVVMSTKVKAVELLDF